MEFKKVGYSLFEHKGIKIAASQAHLIAAASRTELIEGRDGTGIKSEILDIKTLKWKRIRDFGNMKGFFVHTINHTLNFLR